MTTEIEEQFFEIIDKRIEKWKASCYEYSPNHPQRTAINARIDELRRLKSELKKASKN